MAERAYDVKDLVSTLTTSPHGDLRLYAQAAITAAHNDPDFYSHLLVWNHRKGQVRDAKVALPVLALAHPRLPAQAVENALALIADLPPRLFLQAMNFAKDVRNGWTAEGAVRADVKKGVKARAAIPACAAMPVPVRRLLQRLVTRYLRDLEADWPAWERVALRHRSALRSLYARFHIEAGGYKQSRHEATLFGSSRKVSRIRPDHGKFEIVRTLATLSPVEIGGTIAKYQIPFPIARGALGAKAKDPDVALALLNSMTDSELVTNMRALKRMGVQSVPALRGALALRLEKAGAKKGRQKGTLKTTRAAEALADDEALSTKLSALQERQLDHLGSVKGRWLVVADKSGSMEIAIDTANQVAAVLGRMAATVKLVYADIAPRAVDAAGKTYEELTALTAMMTASGGTSLGCALDYAMAQRWEIDGIALVTDGAENHIPFFADMYERYAAVLGKRVPVYWYHVQGDIRAMLRTVAQVHYHRDPTAAEYVGAERARDEEVALFRQGCDRARIVLDRFDLTGGVDYYSLPNLCLTMRTNRYSLADEIMATPLVKIDAVLHRTIGMKVMAEQEQVHA